MAVTAHTGPAGVPPYGVFGGVIRPVPRPRGPTEANNRNRQIYHFNDTVTKTTVDRAICRLTQWHLLKPGCEIEIMFNSPGGSVFAGMDLFDYIQELRRDGHYVTTSARGMAASMAGILLQAGGHRVMGREAQVLIREVSSFAIRKVGEIEDEVTLLKKMSDRVLNIFAERAAEAGRSGTASDPFTKAQLRRGWARRDWWLDSDECFRGGIVDKGVHLFEGCELTLISA